MSFRFTEWYGIVPTPRTYDSRLKTVEVKRCLFSVCVIRQGQSYNKIKSDVKLSKKSRYSVKRHTEECVCIYVMAN